MKHNTPWYERLRNKLISIIAGKKSIVLNVKIDSKQGIISNSPSGAYIENVTITNFDYGLN